MTQEEDPVFGKLATLTDAEYLDHAKIVSRLEDAMLQTASFADVTSAHVLIALARSFSAVWLGLGGDAGAVVPGFAHASLESGFMLLSERLGTRIQSPATMQMAKEALKKVSTDL